MDMDYIKNVFVVFLCSFVFFHIVVSDLDFDSELKWSMMVTGLFIVGYIVKSLAGNKT